MNETKEPLSALIKKIVEKEILLPDFQRNFVWREEERQVGLIASVLAKMPVGSILLLGSKAEDYAYKMIGCKERKTYSELGIRDDIYALLDGQQRVTVLTNAFSNVIFEIAEKSSKLINQKGLQRRFFIKIPKYAEKSVDCVEDYFNSSKLKFPIDDPVNSEPDFLSDEIKDAIKVVSFYATEDDWYNPFIKNKPRNSDIINYCTSGKEYLVPLWLLAGSNADFTLLSQITVAISDNIQLDIVQEFEAIEDDEEKNTYSHNILTESIWEYADDPENITDKDEFKRLLSMQGNDWATNMKEYLRSCLNEIQLHQIKVEESKRARAINIYENLNKGGISLGTFELIMARFASKSNENYYEKIKNNIKAKRQYNDTIFSAELKNNDIVNDIVFADDYIAGLDMHCLENADEDISGAYIEAYLNVISLYSYFPDHNVDKLSVDYIKKNKILMISPDDLNKKCEEVCDALDLALLFFKMRCGIRSIKEINYSLMLAVVAYVLLNENYKSKASTYDALEYWYWSSVLSGFYNSDQNERTITSIKNLIDLLERNNKDWIISINNDVGEMDYFFKKDFILLEKDNNTGITPKRFLRDVVCQYYLRMTYTGLYDKDERINPFFDNVSKGKHTLEKHHVIPLGSLKEPDKIIKEGGEDLRGNDEYFLNSPVNFVYITDEENLLISDSKLSDYAAKINSCIAKTILGLNGDFKIASEQDCKSVLESRYDNFIGSLKSHLGTLL